MEENETTAHINTEFQKDNVDCEVDETISIEEKLDEPKVGMCFSSYEDVFDFYRRYGKEKGFAICKRSSNNDLLGNMRYATIRVLVKGRHGAQATTQLMCAQFQK